MSELPLYMDQAMKQEQYKHLLREAERYRTIKALTQPEPPRNTHMSLRRALVNLARCIPRLGPVGHART